MIGINDDDLSGVGTLLLNPFIQIGSKTTRRGNKESQICDGGYVKRPINGEALGRPGLPW